VYTHILDLAQPFPPHHHPREILYRGGALQRRQEVHSEVELKPLPSHVRYEFLGPNETFAVVVSASLNGIQIVKLLSVLKKYRGAYDITLILSRG